MDNFTAMVESNTSTRQIERMVFKIGEGVVEGQFPKGVGHGG
jgi:hypothetical protein